MPHDLPETPEDFIANWTPTRGNLRNFLETHALPPIDDATQRAAAIAALKAAAPPQPHDEGAAAFFDVDNTLIQGSSLVAFFFGLARRDYFSVREILPVAWKQIKYRLTGSENKEDVAEGREQALSFIKGRSEAELVALCEEIVEEKMQYRAFAGTRALAEAHLKAGQEVWLVSATPVQLADVLARNFGFTGALGTVAEVKDGYFTGRLVGDILHGPGKKHAVEALARHQQLDLARCTAYSDSINDMPMLTMVGNPVAVNPDRHLAKEATQRGWEIRDYRNIRAAVRRWGLPSIFTAAITVAGWRFRHRSR
ncbi:HAD family hydrolase [Corynebacterium caspium]|uniref:HAD family hydrolase n=1 Tax=Corynebacterium caspium TaxID=234828 RepID=UPI00035D50FC|nr:HAD-IB family hydrolase [Corynebacterium caspium]WKD59909.1 Phosphoserine phosphatase [Corynebacterium caspium DSM 44850]